MRRAARPSRPRMARGYADYLQLRSLLRLQRTLSRSHDELQFIVIHQVFELWFKLMLFELTAARDAMLRDDPPAAVHALRRVRTIVQQVTGGFEVIETMRPYDFLEFRSRLNPASGLQSAQFREIEYISGLKDARYVALQKGESAARLRRRASEPSLWDAFVELLRRRKLPAKSDRQVLASVVRTMREDGRDPVAPLADALLEYDQSFAAWRSRHILMVMRMIGSRPGTGEQSVKKLVSGGYDQAMGAGGVDYLKTTLPKLFFPILWEARTMLER